MILMFFSGMADKKNFIAPGLNSFQQQKTNDLIYDGGALALNSFVEILSYTSADKVPLPLT
jgi:hypothetical protein